MDFRPLALACLGLALAGCSRPEKIDAVPVQGKADSTTPAESTGERAAKPEEMTLRDHFAGIALQGLLAGRDPHYDWKFSDTAAKAYGAADAMLEERKRHAGNK